MNFEIEAWERPPDAVTGAVRDGLTDAIEVGPVNWHGQQTLVSVRLLRLVSGEMMPFFHPHSIGVNFVHFEYGSGPLGVLNDLRALRRCIEELNKAERFGFARPFIVGDGLAMARHDSMTWMDVVKKDHFRSSRYCEDTKFSAPFAPLTEPSARVFNWLSQQWQNSDSEVRFAWQWKNRSEDQRATYLKQTVSRWGELRELMHCVVNLYNLSPQFSWVLQGNNNWYPPELRAQLTPWSELLMAHFLPLGMEAENAPVCLMDYLKSKNTYTTIRGETCTAHEQLEARIYLRDWLVRNAPEQLDLLS